MRTCLRTMVAILFCLAAQPTVAFAQDHDGRGTPAIATDHGRDERVFNLSLNDGERLSVLFATPASPSSLSGWGTQ
ncbi:hypothetical protein [Komagataeibacter oboediens]|uniref:hypothetical protein n=1 Tax=Komagataeibacter oboediens TaxID=65958 RepID=UPI000237DA39|nr:hypothetical protein [Komagataeibacter oboediens]